MRKLVNQLGKSFAMVCWLGVSAAAVATPQEARAFGPKIPSSVELVQSLPEGLGLEHPDLKQTATVWTNLISRARGEILIGQMYLAFKDGERTDVILHALQDAG